MSNEVKARLEPVARTSSASQQAGSSTVAEKGIYVTFGSQTFYVTHIKENAQVAHTQGEWNILRAHLINDLIEELRNADQNFDPENVSRIDINCQDLNYSTYTPKGDPKTPGSAAPRFFTLDKAAKQSLRVFANTLGGIGFSKIIPSYGQTIEGSMSQTSSVLARSDVKYRNACTAIDLQFAQRALLCNTAQEIGPTDIDRSVMVGQVKFAELRPSIIRGMEDRNECQRDVTDEEGNPIDDNGQPVPVLASFYDLSGEESHFPLLQRGGDVSNFEVTREGFKNALEDLLTTETSGPAIFGGFTNGRGESFGVVIYKDLDGGIADIVYFDSHMSDMNGVRNACAKRFKTVDEAAAFLAARNPHESDPASPDANSVTVTPFVLDKDFISFNEAVSAFNKASERERAAAYEELEAVLKSIENEKLHEAIEAALKKLAEDLPENTQYIIALVTKAKLLEYFKEQDTRLLERARAVV